MTIFLAWIRAFSVQIDDGDAYSVVVDSQPSLPTQICTLGDPTDAEGNASGALDPIPINCVTTTHVVSGVVSGLLGTGLSLTWSAGDPAQALGDPLSIDSDGGFEFPRQVDDQELYAVQVTTSPTSPPQICQLANGSGAATEAVDGVAISCTIAPFDELRIFATEALYDGDVGGLLQAT